MKIKINSKVNKVTEGMQQAVENKMSVLDKFLSDSDTMKISVTSIKKEISVCAMVVYDGKLVKIEKTGDDFYALISDIGDRLKEKLEKLHTKKIKKQKDQENALNKLDYDVEADEQKYLSQEIVTKRKKVKLVAMSESEAIEEMERLGHESFIFLNELTGNPCMVYTRNDSNYGVIEAE